MLTTIYLGGALGHKHGRKWKLAVSSPAEALRAIEANSPGLAADLIAAGDRGVDFRVKVNGEAITADLVQFRREGATIRISPVVRGRKNGLTSIILGVALVALTWGAGAGLFGAYAQDMMGATFLGIHGLTVGAFIGGMGLSMAIGGISQMLSPMPKGPDLSSGSDGKPSYIFQGPVNTAEQGGPVPLVFGGPILIGSRIVSSSINTENLNAAQYGNPVQVDNEGEGAFTNDPDYPGYTTPATPTNLKGRSLQMRQIMRQIHLLSDGEIAGLCDAAGNILSYEERNKAILFDLTPVQSADGSMAFQNFATAIRNGTASQDWMAGFPSAESETTVEVKVIKGSDKIANAVQRTISAGNHNAIRFSVRFPAMYEVDTTGNHTGSAVQFSIQLKRSAESTWKEVVGSNTLPNGELDGLVQGEALQPTVMSFRVPLYGTGPWDVRILRETADSADPTKVQNDLYWQSYTLITDQKLTFRHSAVAGIEFEAEKFPTAPGVAFRVKGIKVRVPSNYNPDTRNYTGVWDGEFTGCDLELSSAYTAFDTTLAVSAIAADLPLNSEIEIVSGSTTGRAYLMAAASAGATSLSITPIPANLASGSAGRGYELKWTNNPAWIYHAVSTHRRYGLGNYIPGTALDKWALYEISRYSDGVDGSGTFVGVDTGRGDSSREPRFAVNVYIQSSVDAYRLLADLSSAFRGMVYWGSGFITAVQDAPKIPRFNFTDANVIDGSFNFSDTAAKSRHTVCYVQWNDPDDNFAPKLEEVTDDDGVAELGVRPITIIAYGCTSRGQATRAGKWLLLTETVEFETGTFRTQLEGARVRPGDIARIRARFKTVNRMHGRVMAVGSGTLTLDAPVVIGSGTWTVVVAKQDGSEVDLTITDSAGTYTTINVTGSLTGVVPNAVWILRTTTIEAPLYRILNAKELDSRKFEIMALRYIPEKYAAIEDGLALTPPSTSDFPTNDRPAPATDLDVTERAVDTASGTQRFLTLSWAASGSQFVSGYLVEYRSPNGEWETREANTTALKAGPYLVTALGSHSFRVYARSIVGRLSLPATFNYDLAVVTNPDPPVPGSIVATAQAEGIFLQWTNSSSPDLTVAEIQESLTTTFTDPPTSPSPIIGTAPAAKDTKGSFHRGGITSSYTRYFRIRLRNKSGGASTWTAYVSATATVPPTGPAGTRGSKRFYAATTGTSWSDSEADAAVTGAGFTKVIADEVTLYKTSAGYSETRGWSGSAWVTIAQVIDGNLLVHGSVLADALDTTTLRALIATLGGFTFSGGKMTSSSGSFVTEIGPSFGGTAGYFLIEHTGVGHVVTIGGSALGGSISVFDATGVQSINLSGNSGVVTATGFSGNGGSVTGLDASNISGGTMNTARLPATINIATAFQIAGTKVVGAQQAVIANAGTSHSLDASYNQSQLEAVFNAFGAKINEILTAKRNHGLIAT